jgi:phosphoserine phosphatase
MPPHLFSVFLMTEIKKMSKEEIKYEINKVLEHFSDKALTELLAFLKELDTQQANSTSQLLQKILTEDKELLFKLAQ